MLNNLSTINKYTERFVYWLTAVSTFIFILFVLLGVITRYLTKAPILSSIEISRLFFVWACFLAATLAYRRNAHIAISFIVDRFNLQWTKVIDFSVNFLTILFFIFIVKESALVVKLLWYTHLPVSNISQSWLYLPVPFISLVIILFALEKLLISLQKPELNKPKIEVTKLEVKPPE